MRKDDLDKIVREAFGVNARIRLILFKSEIGYQIICLLRHGEHPLVMGQFGKDSAKNDGSEIVVFPKYKSKAEEYTRLYKNLTGKEVNIILSDTYKGGLLVNGLEVKKESPKSKPGYVNPFEIDLGDEE